MTKRPHPGIPVRGSSRGVPIMAAFDLLGRRWAMRILWEISKGPCSFRELQERCGQMSPTSLNLRLRELRASKIVTQEAHLGYSLTELGAELNRALDPLREWSEKWASVSIDDR